MLSALLVYGYGVVVKAGTVLNHMEFHYIDHIDYGKKINKKIIKEINTFLQLIKSTNEPHKIIRHETTNNFQPKWGYSSINNFAKITATDQVPEKKLHTEVEATSWRDGANAA